MSNELIPWTQIGVILGYIFLVFGIYKLFVEQKDAMIQLLKERISTLKDQISEARSSTPDILAQTLSARVKNLEGELERLSQDKGANQQLVHEKEEELRTAQQKAEELVKQVLVAREILKNFLCPQCGSPLSIRECHTEVAEYEGREIDIDHDYTVFECGYSVLDGKPHTPCLTNKERSRSVITSIS